MQSALPMVAPEQERSTKSYRNKIISVVSVGLVVAGGALMVSASRGSSSDHSISNLAAVDGQRATSAVLPMKVDTPKAVVASSKDTKKVEAPKEEKKGTDEKKDVDPREEIDGAKAKKTAKPTVKPTTPPKPTVPPTTKKPSEKKDVQREEAPKGRAPPARSLAEKGNPSPEANPSSGRQEVAHKSASEPIEKKGDVKEAPKEEKKDVEPREIDGAKAKKTSKPTVKPTTPPKPTVPPTTKKPSEKKVVETEKVEGPKQHPASRMLAEAKKAAAPAPKDAPAAKAASMTPPKKADAAPKEEKKDVEPREIDGAKAKKTSKPTVKPTTPPKPTVPPTTKKPSEKHAVQDSSPKGGMAPPKDDHRQLKEEESPLSKALKDAEVKAYKEDKVSAKDEKPAAAKKEEAPKKVDAAPKEEKKDVEPREIDGAKAKKTSKPTVKPTTPPKPTVPPTTKKPSEKKVVQDSKFDRSPRQLKKSSSSLESTVSEAPAPVVEVAADAPVISEEDRHTATDERAEGPKGASYSLLFYYFNSYLMSFASYNIFTILFTHLFSLITSNPNLTLSYMRRFRSQEGEQRQDWIGPSYHRCTHAYREDCFQCESSRQERHLWLVWSHQIPFHWSPQAYLEAYPWYSHRQTLRGFILFQ